MQIVTHCDRSYAARCLAMLHSLKAVANLHRVTVLVTDDSPNETLLSFRNQFPEVRLMALSELERGDKRVNTIRISRERKEFMFALTPFLIKHVQGEAKEPVLYLDADLYFYRSPSHLEAEIGSNSVTVMPHGFPPNRDYSHQVGTYNVGIIHFSGDSDSKRVLDWWATQCHASTELSPEKRIYGDQMYLDEFRSLTTSLGEFNPCHFGQAPWNAGSSHFGSALDCQNLPSAFHFSGIQVIGDFYLLSYRFYRAKPSKQTRNTLFRNYVDVVQNFAEKYNLNTFKKLERISLKDLLKVILYRDFLRDK